MPPVCSASSAAPLAKPAPVQLSVSLAGSHSSQFLSSSTTPNVSSTVLSDILVTLPQTYAMLAPRVVLLATLRDSLLVPPAKIVPPTSLSTNRSELMSATQPVPTVNSSLQPFPSPASLAVQFASPAQ